MDSGWFGLAGATTFESVPRAATRTIVMRHNSPMLATELEMVNSLSGSIAVASFREGTTTFPLRQAEGEEVLLH